MRIETAGEALDLVVGASLGEIRHEPPTAVEVAWFLVATFDRNPIHVDAVFASQAGLPSVIIQTSIPFGYLLGRLGAVVGPQRIVAVDAAFRARLLPGNAVTTEVVVSGVEQEEDHVRVSWQLLAVGDQAAQHVVATADSLHY